MSLEDRVRPIERANWALGAGAVATCAVVGSPAFAFSVALGTLIEAFNFRGMALGALRLFQGDGAGRALWTGLLAMRFLLLGVALWLAVRGGVDPRGLVFGLSIILPASILGAWQVRPPSEETPPAPPPDDPSWDEWNPWLARERRVPEDDWDADA
jgi:hypothetical protein